MKLVLDQGLPRSAVTLLIARGFGTVHVGEIGLAAATDASLIERARNDGRTIVTLDADFHALIALEGTSSPSVIRIREEGLKGLELAELVVRTVDLCRADLDSGAVVTVRGDSVRVRSLPVRGRPA